MVGKDGDALFIGTVLCMEVTFANFHVGFSILLDLEQKRSMALLGKNMSNTEVLLASSFLCLVDFFEVKKIFQSQGETMMATLLS